MTPQEQAALMKEAADHHQALGVIFQKMGQPDNAHFQFGEAAAARNWAEATLLVTAPPAK